MTTTTAVGALDDAALPTESDAGRNADVRLIRRLKISGMLSFGPKGIDLELEPLNVLIGANGSGKSNFIEALALLHAAPRDLSAPVRQMGGISEWLWKGDNAPGEAVIKAVIDYPQSELPLLHTLTVVQSGSHIQLTDEAIEYFREPVDPEGKDLLYHFLRGTAVLRENAGANPPAPFKRDRKLRVNSINPEESVLSQGSRSGSISGIEMLAGTIRGHPPVPQLGIRSGRRPAPIAAGRPAEHFPDRTRRKPGPAAVQAAGRQPANSSSRRCSRFTTASRIFRLRLAADAPICS